MSRSLLVVSRQSPWSGPGAREALDIVLAGGAFDLSIGLLFLDDGVFQLSPQQFPGALQQKDLTANLKALSMFGVEELYACGHSLAERGIPLDALSEEISPLSTHAGLSALFDRYDEVITI
ncbi:sulfurtransferase complex subunit TusC [Pseudomonas syringae pv. tagetis]|uniref:Sulfurtransferase complex subunit TusC n=3 Tax=Pseudomonas syringae group TaxID=136849 RepID=A0A0Q0C6Y7_9PSED|nr:MULTISPECIES: sulfurtransferase complex subunit TusC [Pseudomonas syringae group]KPX42383.1 tRNA 5-methylaminomethyl-2-thiouridine synthase TusC [Pseudomonas syringae pv. helianthi]KPY83111.1 tRNA 5-methylaminomethyl-2-thiouridine synthase TusC [Pseudomonas syringae pv. tagetis]RMR08911.1 tRNA 5-methylaminomethyl-2-thiouridine synthase TusC [Pseudomonas syringae pv. helianthi]RMV09862.1 tRNA 5-methylaminomethyl-2-thiouridine synthase TusC [Pseudomonas savastanoi]RMV47259.1 tRNA 5-methylamin